MPEVPQSLQPAPTPETPAAPAPVPEKVPTPEEIKALATANEQEWFGGLVKKEKEPAEPVEQKVEVKPEEKAAEPGKPKLAVEAVDPSAGPAPTTPAPAPAKPEVDEDDLVDRVAERVGEKLAPQPVPAEKAPPADPFAAYGKKERTQLETLKFISETDPRFKGRDLAKETVRFWENEANYIRQWQKQNEGEQFDASASEHQDFYRRNEPHGVSRDDLDEARVRMEVVKETRRIEEKFERKARQEMDERLAPIERDRVMQEKTPVIKQAINASVAEMVSLVVPDVVGDKGLTAEVIKKIEEEDPVVMELLAEESNALNVRVRELESMRHLGQHFQFNKELVVKAGNQRITPHADIVDTVLELEEAILAKPVADQLDEGRRFLTRAERAQRLDEITNSRLPIEEKRRRFNAVFEKFWTVEFDDVRAAFVAKSAAAVNRTLNIAKKRAKHQEEKSTRSGGTNGVSNGTSTPAPSVNRTPVTSGGVAEMVNTKVPGSGTQMTQDEINRKAWFD